MASRGLVCFMDNAASVRGQASGRRHGEPRKGEKSAGQATYSHKNALALCFVMAERAGEYAANEHQERPKG